MSKLFEMIEQEQPSERVLDYVASLRLDALEEIRTIMEITVASPQEKKTLRYMLWCLRNAPSDSIHRPSYVGFIAAWMTRYRWGEDIRCDLAETALSSVGVSGSYAALYISLAMYSEYIPGTLVRWCRNRWYEPIEWFPVTGTPLLGEKYDRKRDGPKPSKASRLSILSELVECAMMFPEARPHLKSMHKFIKDGVLLHLGDYEALKVKIDRVEKGEI